MSLLVAIKDNGKFYVGCDTRHSRGEYYYDSYYFCPKAFFVDINNGLIVGCAGLPILGNIASSILKDDNIKSLNKEYLCEVFWPKYYKSCLALSGTDKYNEVDGELIIIQKDKGFGIDGSGAVLEIIDTYTIGSGSPIADAVIHTLNNYRKLSPEATIIACIEEASKIRNDVSSEVYIASSDDIKFTKRIITLK